MINAKEISFNEVNPPNVRANPLPDHGSSLGPSINMISIAAIGEEDDVQEIVVPFIIDYAPAKIAVVSASFVVEVPAKEPYQDRRVPWNYGGNVANMEQEMSAMGITRSGQVYQGLEPTDKGKAPIAAFPVIPEATPLPAKKVTEQEAKAFMKVLIAAQVSKEIAPDKIEEAVNSIFSNQISFAEDELPSEGQGDLQALHIVCKFNNHIVGQAMIDNGSALNVCSISTLKQMKVDMSRIRASNTIVQAFNGSKREVNGEIDLLIDIHAASTVPSSLHQKLNFFVEGKLITINGEENYAIYKETTVPYISIWEDQNLPFHSFDTISVIRDYGEVGPSRADRMIGKAPIESKSRIQRFEFIRNTPGKSLPIYFGEGRDEDGRVPKIEESLHHLENHQLTSYKPTKEINIGTAEEQRTLRIGTGRNLAQKARMIDFLTEYQEVFAWSYTDMPGLDPSIVKHFLSLDTEKFLPKRQHLQRQRADLLILIKE
ncbi:hypothetical protein CRG98_022949 [Punica granatum]|uniref:Retrotransposon gag domain-containing protein n=1 Tax=Punica granatum TaxID=22663 RepID=A0A2I0JK59_PUNGR|nr:hypothetical protein CRG98_022949 [Punica granatum]